MSRENRTYGGHRIFVGDIGPRVGKYDLEREFDSYGPLVDVWVARFVKNKLFIFSHQQINHHVNQ